MFNIAFCACNPSAKLQSTKSTSKGVHLSNRKHTSFVVLPLYFNHVRCHSEFNTDEYEAVRERLDHAIQVLDHVIFTTHNFQKFLSKKFFSKRRNPN